METLEKRVQAIEARNNKVELDKAWETSWIRRVSIAILTYLIIASYLYVINNDNPLINGIVPVIGFLLSTFALSWIKQSWQKKRS